MKTMIKSTLAWMLFLGCHAIGFSQQKGGETPGLTLGKVAPYKMEVTYNKTSHILFPAAIRYVDLGSDYLIAGKAEDAENVLRVKARVRDFEEETNFSVITEDGRFYSFNVDYDPCPASLSYDLLSMEKTMDRREGNDVLFEELSGNRASLTSQLLETIYQKDKRIIRHIGSRSYGIQLSLKGIYTHKGQFYFHSELRNKSNVPFRVDFVNFKIVDKKVGRRTVVQEKPLTLLRSYTVPGEIAAKNVETNVFLLDQVTLDGDKALVIEVFEKGGGRHQVMQVENADLVRAKVLEDMHLTID